MTPHEPTPAPSAGERLRDHWRGEAERWAAVSAHLPVGGEGRLGAALGLSRKAARYLLRWYINPIVEQQNHFNAALLGLDALRAARERELLREIADLRERVAALERQLAAPDRAP
jgi:hypothetical protein